MAQFLVDKQNQRAKGFKKGIDGDEARRGREETTIKLRKEKKQEQLSQRRKIVGTHEWRVWEDTSPIACYVWVRGTGGV